VSKPGVETGCRNRVSKPGVETGTHLVFPDAGLLRVARDAARRLIPQRSPIRPVGLVDVDRVLRQIEIGREDAVTDHFADVVPGGVVVGSSSSNPLAASRTRAAVAPRIS